MEEFNLLEHEKIVKDLKPKKKLKTAFGVQFFLIFFLSFHSWFWIIPLIMLFDGEIFVSSILLGFIIVSFLIVVGLSFYYAEKKFEKQHYWITNKRIIYKRGFLGYKISSIPLERISDIIVSRTFFETLFGFGSLHVQTLAGQISPGAAGAEAQLTAVDDPEKIQSEIFDLIKKKRKDEHITM